MDIRHKLKSLLFIDIETVCSAARYEDLPERMQALWNKKSDAKNYASTSEGASYASLFYDKAAFFAEFGKVVCIAFGGLYYNDQNELSLKVRSFTSQNEKQLLTDLIALIEKYPPDLTLCAHNGKEFDFPFLCRRMLINGLSIPTSLQIQGKKPWEIRHEDTMEMWKFGDYKSYTSLDLLAAVFDIPGSKGDMSGDQVTKVFYEQNDLERIARYCREDVAVLAQIYLRLQSAGTIKPENIFRTE